MQTKPGKQGEREKPTDHPVSGGTFIQVRTGADNHSAQFCFVDRDIDDENEETDKDMARVKTRTMRRRKRTGSKAPAATASAGTGVSTGALSTGPHTTTTTTTAVRNFFSTLDPVAISCSPSWAGSIDVTVDKSADIGPMTNTYTHTRTHTNTQQQQAIPKARDITVSVKLEGEARPYPSAPEVLEKVLVCVDMAGLSITGMVRTGACYYDVRVGDQKNVEQVAQCLHGVRVKTFTVSARKAGERLPMYVVLSAPFRLLNSDIHAAMSQYGEVRSVTEQKYRQWPSVSNGHHSVTFTKVTKPLPSMLALKGARLRVRAYGDSGKGGAGGDGGNRCYNCGEVGHFKVDCRKTVRWRRLVESGDTDPHCDSQRPRWRLVQPPPPLPPGQRHHHHRHVHNLQCHQREPAPATAPVGNGKGDHNITHSNNSSSSSNNRGTAPHQAHSPMD